MGKICEVTQTSVTFFMKRICCLLFEKYEGCINYFEITHILQILPIIVDITNKLLYSFAIILHGKRMDEMAFLC